MLALASCLLALATGAHPESQSHSRVTVTGARAEVELRFQSLSLIEFHPELDRSRDGVLDASEVAAARAEIGAYLLGGYRLFRIADGGEERLPGELTSLVPGDPARLGAFELQELVAVLQFVAPAPLESLVVETQLFQETNPWHRDTCTLSWNGEPAVQYTFTATSPRRLFPDRARRRDVLGSFLRLGLTHVLGTAGRRLPGADALLFLLALLLAARRGRTLVGGVAAFLAGEALTLGAGALGWVNAPERFVALAIALSIAYVACDNLLRPSPRSPRIEALLFGLLYGLGLADVLALELAGDPLVGTALFAFGLGIELVQLAFVLFCALALALLFRVHRRDPAAGTAPPRVRMALSLVLALAGFYGFCGRAGWLPWA